MKKILAFVCLLLVSGVCFGQVYSLKDFKEKPFPMTETHEWYILGNSNDFPFVMIERKKLKITKRLPERIPNFRLPGGLLIAVNAGEWGGGLYYKPNDTTKKQFSINGKIQKAKKNPGSLFDDSIGGEIKNTIEIAFGQKMSLFMFNDSLYAREWSNLGFVAGSLSKFEMRGDSILFTQVASFNKSPMAITSYKNKLYVVTDGQLYTIENQQIKLVIEKGIWEELFPTSIAVRNENEVFVGMRGGYAKVNLRTKQTTFYKYNK